MKRLISCMAVLCLAALLAALTVGCGGTSSSGNLAYVSNSTGTGFKVFTVSTQGPLTNPSQQNTPAPPKQLQISANGKWAFFLENSGNRIFGFTRSGNGTFVNPITGSPFNLTSSGSSIVITPNNKFLYAAIPGSNDLAIFVINQSTGELTQIGTNHVGDAITQLAIRPDGSALFGLAPTNQEVVGFRLDPNSGSAQKLSTGSIGFNAPDKGLILSADGNFIYVPDQSQPPAGVGPVIYGFSTNANGDLEPIAGVTFNEHADANTHIFPTVPVGGATSNDNRWLFIANQGSHNISVFDIHTVGGGDPREFPGVAPSPYDCGTFVPPEVSCSPPSFIAVSKLNNAIYVLDTNAARIFQLAVDQSTGVLRSLEPHSVDAGPTPVWITIR